MEMHGSKRHPNQLYCSTAPRNMPAQHASMMQQGSIHAGDTWCLQDEVATLRKARLTLERQAKKSSTSKKAGIGSKDVPGGPSGGFTGTDLWG